MKLVCLCITVFFVALLFNSCKHDLPFTDLDHQMLEMARPTTGFTWYKHSDSFLNKSSASGHNYSFLRTRYNPIAARALDSNGKIKPGATFAEGSFIVKELSNGSTAERYALLWKQTGSPAADERGWIWGYINSNETVALPASTTKGRDCKGCHGQQDNIDYMLMNKYFP